MVDVTDDALRLLCEQARKRAQPLHPTRSDPTHGLRSKLADTIEALQRRAADAEAKTNTARLKISEIYDERDRLAGQVEALRDAADAAETILRVTPQINSNASGTKPTATTRGALLKIRNALAATAPEDSA